MNAVPMSRPTVGSISIGVSRISVRHAHTSRYKKPQPELSGHPPKHGEKIWIWDHVKTKQVVHGLFPVMDVYKAQKQFPFSGKHSKPAKIRKDLWRQLCIVEFPEGRGDVGQSVFARLREFRRRHELEWGDELLWGPNKAGDKQRLLTRQERGKKIQEQRDNAIADLAAVLAGAGRGNRIFKVNQDDKKGGKAGKKVKQEEGDNAEETLVPVTIQWANNLDRNYAREWSSNVTHGMLPWGKVWELEPEDPLLLAKPEQISEQLATEEGTKELSEPPRA